MQALRRTLFSDLRNQKCLYLPLFGYTFKNCVRKINTLNRTVVTTTSNRFIGFSLNDCIVLRLLSTEAVLDLNTYEQLCSETLESLCEYFEELVESSPHLKSTDVTYGDGVLTVNFGDHGTYVINRQTPNRQIWLSSPTSGPKRYDFVKEGGYWLYKHNGQTLHQLLQSEIKDIVKKDVDFSRCAYGVLSLS